MLLKVSVFLWVIIILLDFMAPFTIGERVF